MRDDEPFEAFVLLAEPQLRHAFIGARGLDGATEATAEALAYMAAIEWARMMSSCRRSILSDLRTYVRNAVQPGPRGRSG